MNKKDLQERYENILNIIINSYITNGNPVGSRYVSRMYKPTLSPATIRNIMADLEEDGLIEQPHTSAGRTPTDSGYRYYVNSLQDYMSTQEEITLRHNTGYQHPRHTNLDELMEQVAHFLSSAIGQISLVLYPQEAKSYFSSLQLYPIQNNRILLVLITTSGFVYNSVVENILVPDNSTLSMIIEYLNDSLQEKELSEIVTFLKNQLKDKTDNWYNLLQFCITLIEESNILKKKSKKLYSHGVEKILEQPEFRNDLDKMKAIIHLIEEQAELMNILSQDIQKNDNLHVYIGSENQFGVLDDCTFITAKYSIADYSGMLGILGPKRMNYSSIFYQLNSIDTLLQGLINDQLRDIS